MKYKFLWCVLFLASLLHGYPAPRGWINDYTGKLSQGTLVKLTGLTTELKEKTGFELAVAIVPNLEGEEENAYAANLYEKWGIGSSKDEGALLLIAVEERFARIEVGYGAEEFLTDGTAGQIRDDFLLPYLKNGDYNAGVSNALNAVAYVAANHYGVTITGVSKNNLRKKSRKGGSLFSLLLFLIILRIFFGGGRGRRGGGGGFLAYLLLSSLTGRSFGGFGGGSGRGGFDGFGGFGGFGGGSSGGGGAGGHF